MGTGNTASERDRPRWGFTPFVSVGPLRFGMVPDDVAGTLGNEAGISVGTQERQFPELGVSAYFSKLGELACVAVHAAHGPQVGFKGTDVVGRVPSDVEKWFLEYAELHEVGLIYTHEGNPGSVDLGLVIRVQRVGDVVATRPLFLTREWALGLWDHVPSSEWQFFH